MSFLLLMQHPTKRQPVGQYSKGHAPPCQSPAVTEPHTHLVIIMTPPVPSVLNNLAGVSLATAPPAEWDHLLSANSSYRLHSHCLLGFLIGLHWVGYWLDEDAVTQSSGLARKELELKLLWLTLRERVFCFWQLLITQLGLLRNGNVRCHN